MIYEISSKSMSWTGGETSLRWIKSVAICEQTCFYLTSANAKRTNCCSGSLCVVNHAGKLINKIICHLLILYYDDDRRPSSLHLWVTDYLRSLPCPTLLSTLTRILPPSSYLTQQVDSLMHHMRWNTARETKSSSIKSKVPTLINYTDRQ